MDVPTKLPMTLSNVCYVSSARTTVCDIMCTINTYQQIEKSSVPINLRSLVATLPYEKNKAGFRKGKTKFEDHKISEVKMRLIEELKRDRDDFFHKLKREKQEKDRIRGKAATKIQAIYRGYRQRPRPTPYVRRRKPVVSLLQYEVQDELCKMSTALNLKPIAGLNLEPRSKTSKRRRKIETAAAFRIQRLFQMITARNKARLVVDQKKVERIHRSAVVITNSFRYLKTKNFIKSYETMRRNQMVIKLQCQIRYFQAVAK